MLVKYRILFSGNTVLRWQWGNINHYAFNMNNQIHFTPVHYTDRINTVYDTTTLFNHSTLLYKVVQGHLVTLEQ